MSPQILFGSFGKPLLSLLFSHLEINFLKTFWEISKHLNTNSHNDDISNSINGVNDIIINNSGSNLPLVEPSAHFLSQFSTQTDFRVDDDYECSNFVKCIENVSYAGRSKTELTPKPMTFKSKASIYKSHLYI